MDFLQPTTWPEALTLRAERPDALPIAGGTDVMVDLNFDRRRPGALLDLGRVAELREWGTDDGWIRLGAGVPYARVIDELGASCPGWPWPRARSDPRRSGSGAPPAATSARRPRPVTRTRRCWPPGRWSRWNRPPAAPG